jgi:hypothetical protein
MHAPTVNLHDVSAEHIARSINERLNS